MKSYDHKKIEKKWQKFWDENQIYKTDESSDKPKQFVLDMFPYPSGVGLHVGHPRGFIATDVFSRMKRMQGFNVLHPMGWDAFGLPTENFAIANNIHPRVAAEQNIAKFKEQLAVIGFDHDWSREINTTDPEFYRWTQWIFLQMYHKGLAYESWEPINWCPGCQTGLANEDVESDGTCERCGSVVEKKPMRQWVLKITDYADRMLTDLDKLPKWPEGVKEAQRNWIGKSEGSEIDFKIADSEEIIKVFTTRADTLFGVTALVLAPEHPLVEKMKDSIENWNENVFSYIQLTREVSEEDRSNTHKQKQGYELKGIKAVNPINGEFLPIWIADYVLPNYATGAIMLVPGHDERDFEFAQYQGLPIKTVIELETQENIEFKQIISGSGVGYSVGNPAIFQITDKNRRNILGRKYENLGQICNEIEGVLVNSAEFSGMKSENARIKITEAVGGKLAKKYRMKDWVFSRQRYWGEPIPMIHCSRCGVVPVPESDLPVRLPEVIHYEPTGDGKSPLDTIEDWVNVNCPTCGGAAKRETNTMPSWAGSSWYYLRYIDPKNNSALVDPTNEKEWMPVDVYAGADHATRHLIYARFWHKFLFDIGSVSTEEPFPRLEFLGYILAESGKKFSKRDGNGIDPVDVINKFGADAFRLYEMFIGPFEQTAKWDMNGMVGTLRFVERIWRFSETLTFTDTPESLARSLHKTIKKVGGDIESFKFNTAVAALMIFANDLEAAKQISRDDWKKFIQILAPFAPHITEEIWQVVLDETKSVHVSSWPTFDSEKVIDDTVTIGVQVNGKVRAEITISFNEDEKTLREKVINLPEIVKWTHGADIKKFIYIPGKIINIVI